MARIVKSQKGREVRGRKPGNDPPGEVVRRKSRLARRILQGSERFAGSSRVSGPRGPFDLIEYLSWLIIQRSMGRHSRGPASRNRMRCDTELGMFRLKTILALLLLGVAGYVCKRVFPPYFANSQLRDKMYEEARFAEANERSAEQLRDIIHGEAQKLDIPVRREDIHVEKHPNAALITADYTVTVDLYYYQVDWAFHPTSVR